MHNYSAMDAHFDSTISHAMERDRAEVYTSMMGGMLSSGCQQNSASLYFLPFLYNKKLARDDSLVVLYSVVSGVTDG